MPIETWVRPPVAVRIILTTGEEFPALGNFDPLENKWTCRAKIADLPPNARRNFETHMRSERQQFEPFGYVLCLCPPELVKLGT